MGAAEPAHPQALSEETSSSRPELHELVASTGISLHLWHLYAQAWLVCLLVPILALIHLHLGLVDLLLRLLSELDGARQLLEAAGIAYQIEHTAEALPQRRTQCWLGPSARA
jgi:hypothetical protein